MFSNKALKSLLIPLIIEQFLAISLGIADTMMVSTVGESAVSGVSLVDMLNVLIIDIFAGLASGGAVVASQFIGAKNRRGSERSSGQLILIAAISGIAVSAAVLLLRRPLLRLLFRSVEDEVMASALTYFTVTALSFPFISVYNAAAALFRSMGNSRISMISSLVINIINIIGNSIFIFGFGMGVAGAALATVLSNLLSVAYYVRYFLRKSACLSVSPRLLSPDGYICKSILLIGVPAFINNILITVAQILLNNHAAAYGDDVVAALGIVSRTTSLPVLLLIGLAQGVQPLIAYNYAAGNRKRLTGTMKLTALSGTALALLLAVLLYALAGPVVSAFLDKAEVVRLGVRFLRVNVCSVPFLASLFLLMNVFQGMGKALPSLILSICRQGVIFLPLLLLGDIYYGLNGIVWAQPAADILSTFIAALMFLLLYRAQKHAAQAEQPLRMADSSDSSDPSDSSGQDSPS